MRIPHIRSKPSDAPIGKEPKKEEIEVAIDTTEYLDDLGLFDNKKEYVKWVIRMKKMIRDSFEYQELIYFLKRKHGMECCGVHPNLTVWNGFRIELHHTPFCLEDIVHIVTNKRLKRSESMKMTDIAYEIMELHYLGLVGLYPLCAICHAYAHNKESVVDDLFIPMDRVYGDPVKFYELYEPYMTDGIATKWHNIVQLNKGYNLIARNIPLELQKKYIYIKPILTKKEEKTFGSHKSEIDVMSTTKLAEFIRTINNR